MSLRVWLPLNGDLTNQGLTNLQFSYQNNNSKLVVDNSGKIGKCYSRNTLDTNDLIRSNSTINLSGDISMACWAYVTNAGTSANGLVTNHSHADNTGVGITIRQISSSDYRISCNTGDGSSRTYYTYYGTTNIKNAWHHLALTYSKSNKKLQLWVDGKVEYTLSNYSNASKSDYIDLFNWSTTNSSSSNYRPVCKLNDVRIYDHCLSAKEVKEISKGLVLHFPLHGEEGGTNLIKGIAECTATSAGSETLGGPLTYDTSLLPLNSLIGKTFIFSYDYSVEGPKANATGDYSKDRFGSHLTLTYKDASGNAGTAYPGASYLEASGTGRAVQTYTCSSSWTEITGLTIALQPYNKPASGNNNTWYIKNFKIEVGDTDTGYSINPSTLGLASNEISDCSGYGHTGTKVLTSYVKNSPRYDASCAMLGAAVDTTSNTLTGASYITARIPLAASSAMTVSWWGKIVKYGRGGVFETTAYEYDPINGTDYNTTAFANWDSTFSVYNGTTRVNLYSDLVKVDSQWYLHTITYDGSNVKYYRNGTLISTNALAGTLPAITAIRIGIGKAGGVYRQIQQYVSDFRMYVTTLSAEDVKELYQIPISIDKNGDMFSLSYSENGTKHSFYKSGIVEGALWEKDEPFSLMKNNIPFRENLFKNSNSFGLTGSDFPSVSTRTVGKVVVSSDSIGNAYAWIQGSIEGGMTSIFNSTKTMTLSIDIKVENATNANANAYGLITIDYRNSSHGALIQTTRELIIDGKWHRYILPITANNGGQTQSLLCLANFQNLNGATIYYKNIKYEEGATGSPWCPSKSEGFTSNMTTMVAPISANQFYEV